MGCWSGLLLPVICATVSPCGRSTKRNSRGKFKKKKRKEKKKKQPRAWKVQHLPHERAADLTEPIVSKDEEWNEIRFNVYSALRYPHGSSPQREEEAGCSAVGG